MNPANTIIIWNIRGFRNDLFKRNHKELINAHYPCILALLETKLDDNDALRMS